jgi:hypothetical protein
VNGHVVPLRASADRGTEGTRALEAAGRHLDRCKLATNTVWLDQRGQA